jgi:transcriptional regulator with XRE-family HTH domain
MDLRMARQGRGLTQEQLADRSGLPQTTISDIERGAIKKPSWDAVARIARALNYEPQELFPIDLGEAPKAVAS